MISCICIFVHVGSELADMKGGQDGNIKHRAKSSYQCAYVPLCPSTVRLLWLARPNLYNLCAIVGVQLGQGLKASNRPASRAKHTMPRQPLLKKRLTREPQRGRVRRQNLNAANVRHTIANRGSHVDQWPEPPRKQAPDDGPQFFKTRYY